MRKDLGIFAVVLDILLMTLFLLALWAIQWLVQLDSERHRQLLFETKEFAVTVNNLPELGYHYSIEQLKAELWDHV